MQGCIMRAVRSGVTLPKWMAGHTGRVIICPPRVG